MRKPISNDTGEPPTMGLKTDVEIHADGEGGIYLTLCWHEMKTLGSVAVHLPPDKANNLVIGILAKCGELDK